MCTVQWYWLNPLISCLFHNLSSFLICSSRLWLYDGHYCNAVSNLLKPRLDLSPSFFHAKSRKGEIRTTTWVKSEDRTHVLLRHQNYISRKKLGFLSWMSGVRNAELTHEKRRKEKRWKKWKKESDNEGMNCKLKKNIFPKGNSKQQK